MAFVIYKGYNNNTRFRADKKKLATTLTKNKDISFNTTTSEKIGKTSFVLVALGEEERQVKIRPAQPDEEGAIPLRRADKRRARISARGILREMNINYSGDAIALRTTFDGEWLTIDVSPLYKEKVSRAKREVNKRLRKPAVNQPTTPQNESLFSFPEIPDTSEPIALETPAQTPIPETPVQVEPVQVEPVQVEPEIPNLSPNSLIQLIQQQGGDDFIAFLLRRESQKIISSDPR